MRCTLPARTGAPGTGRRSSRLVRDRCHRRVTVGRARALTHAAVLVCFNSLAMPPRTPRISVASPTGQQWRIGHGAPGGRGLRGGRHPAGPTRSGPTTSSTASGPTEWSHSGRGQVLAPWPNRLADGRYDSTGCGPRPRSTSPSAATPSTAWCAGCPGPSRPATRTSSRCACNSIPRPAIPFSLLLELEYHVGRDGLTVTTTGAVAGRGPGPVRPRLPPLPDGRARDGRRRHPAACRPTTRSTWTTVACPTGALTPGGGDRAGLHHRRASSARPCSTRRSPPSTATPTAGPGPASTRRAAPAAPRCGSTPASPISWCTRATRWARCRRRRRAVAIEPMTCPPNALRTGKDHRSPAGPGVVGRRWGIVPAMTR